MDVTVPSVPAAYDAYRARLRAFIAEHCPSLGWKPRAGLRVPESAADVEILRTWVRALYDAGYVLERFCVEACDPYEQRILEEELAATGIPYVLGNPLVAGALKAFGTDEQRERFLPPMARGDHIWTQLFSEPNAGSDLASLRTRARFADDHYVVSGQKVWSTWAQWADYGYLLARTEDVSGPGGISAFVLDMHSPGVEVRPLREITGTSDFSEVFLEDVRVPAANMIGTPGEGWKVATTSLATERSAVGANPSDRLIDDLVRLARCHHRNGKPAIANDAVRQEIAALAARSHIRRWLGYKAATRAARDEATPWDAPLLKIWFSELNLDICDCALRLQGARSLLVDGDPFAYDEGRWQDAFLYARAWTIAGGTNEVLRNVIAERGLGLPREPRGARP